MDVRRVKRGQSGDDGDQPRKCWRVDALETDAQGNAGVTLITLNRPKALNALNSQVLTELIEAFAAYQADATQLCAVLTGAGEKAFAAAKVDQPLLESPRVLRRRPAPRGQLQILEPELVDRRRALVGGL